MGQVFYWTARLFEGKQVKEVRYFESQIERDAFVLTHEGWKKRGKICQEHLKAHLSKENGEFVPAR